MGTLLRVIAAHRAKAAVFMLALATLVWFGVSFVADAIYFNDPKHRNPAIEEWMTPRYVSRSWKVPPDELAALLGLPPRGSKERPPTMGDISAELGISLEELEARIAAISEKLRTERQGGNSN